VFVRHADAVKCGPGTSRRSHTPDEYVDLPEVTAARSFYAAVAREYLA
jgi:acetylornithine deacetylase/succinyl-diaminopimelate desuccinylase-like protein